MTVAADQGKGQRGGRRPGAGRKPKEGRAQVSPPVTPAKPAAGRAPAASAVSIEYTDARAAHEYWKAQLAEQEFRKRDGELLPRDQIEQGAATLFASIAQTIRGWSDNLERVAGLSPEQAEAIERMVDGLCLTIQDKARKFREGGK